MNPMQLSPEQKARLVEVLTPEEIAGANHPALRFGPTMYATSAFSIWHAEPANEGLVGDTAVETFVAARRSAITMLKSVPETSMSLLRVSAGCDPLKQAAKWNAARAARR